MPYSADINRANPGCFLFLIDQSGSMGAALAGQPGQRKMDQAAEAINGILNAVSLRCSQGMEIRDYFHIGIVTYTSKYIWEVGKTDLATVFPGTSLGNPFLPISEVVDIAEVEERLVKESDGDGGIVEVTRKVPVWLRPRAKFGNPVCAALTAASECLGSWISQHRDSFPPIVIHVTDGEYAFDDPEPQAQEIMGLATDDGNVLLFNIHLSEVDAMPVQYPDRETSLPNAEAKLLFRMSSVLPEPSRNLAATMGLAVSENSRGFVFNSNVEALVQFLDIGTRGPSNLH
jgi:hypothetical protein